MICLYLFALASVPQSRTGPFAGDGWLYPGGNTRLVRFVTESDDPKDPRIFFPAPQNSGFILLNEDTFSISIAEAWGTALLEYKKGVLLERCITDSEGGLGDFQAREGKRMPFAEAFSTAMDEVAGNNLGLFCSDWLTNPKAMKSAQRTHLDYGHGASCDIVFGAGRGALRSYSQVVPQPNPPGPTNIFKRTVCKFTVVIGEGKD